VLNFYYHNVIIQSLYCMWLIKVVMKSWNEFKISHKISLSLPPVKLKFNLYVYIYRVSQEKCATLRYSVPYVNVYWYNPKHLLPLLYYCHPSTFIQLFTIITDVSQVGNTWKNYVKYDETKYLIIMFTLTFKIGIKVKKIWRYDMISSAFLYLKYIAYIWKSQ